MMPAVIAFLPTLGFQEILLIVVVGIILYGRNLPDVGRKVGRSVAHLRRSMNEFKDQLNRDESVRELRDTVRETRDEIRRAGAVPRALTNPGLAVRDATKAALTGALQEPAQSAGTAAPRAELGPAQPDEDVETDDGIGTSNGEAGSVPRSQPPPDGDGSSAAAPDR